MSFEAAFSEYVSAMNNSSNSSNGTWNETYSENNWSESYSDTKPWEDN